MEVVAVDGRVRVGLGHSLAWVVMVGSYVTPTGCAWACVGWAGCAWTCAAPGRVLARLVVLGRVLAGLAVGARSIDSEREERRELGGKEKREESGKEREEQKEKRKVGALGEIFRFFEK